MVASAERLSDLDELHVEHFAREIHRDLPRHGEALDARLRAQSFRRDAPATRDDVLNLVDRRQRLRLVAVGRLTRPNPVGESIAGELDRDLAVPERRIEEELDDRALELADV